MRFLARKIVQKIWPVLKLVLPKNNFLMTFDKKIQMAVLHDTNIVQWRVERAKEMGAKVGKNCRFYSLNFFSEPYLIEIGDNVIISGDVNFVTHDGGIYLFKEEKKDLFGNFGRIRIGNNCFIGIGSTILPNVEIGDNSIVGAGAVVANSFPEDSVIAGNPGKAVFRTSVYKKMKLKSPFTVTHETYHFPFQDKIPEDLKKKILLEKIGTLPIRQARKRVC